MHFLHDIVFLQKHFLRFRALTSDITLSKHDNNHAFPKSAARKVV